MSALDTNVLNKLASGQIFTGRNSSLAIWLLRAMLTVFALVADGSFLMEVWNKPGNSGLLVWTFLASSVSSIVGFAYSPLAGSVIFHFIDNHVEAVSILLVSSISLQSYAVFRLRKHFDWRAFSPFIFGGCLGLGPGLFCLLTVDSAILTRLVGILSISYGLLVTAGAKPKLDYKGRAGDVVVGFLGGLTGPIAAFPGAFITIWCSTKSNEKLQQRAIYQPYIFLMQIVCVGLLWSLFPERGLFRFEHLLFALPAMLGAVVGVAIFRKLSNSQFQRLLGVFLVIAGTSLLGKGFEFEFPTLVGLVGA